MGAMDDAVENGVSQGGITDDFMPAIDRDLAGDQQRPPVVTVVVEELTKSVLESAVPGVGIPTTLRMIR